MMVVAIEATLVVVVVVVSIIFVPFITSFVVAMWWTIRLGNPGDMFTVT